MIRNVIAVHRLPCSELQGLTSDLAANHILDAGEDMHIQVPAKLSYNSKVVNNVTLWDTKLVFRTCPEPDVVGHYAYRLQLANSTVIVLGSSERPYPVTTSSTSINDNLSDSQLNEITVSFTSNRKPL